MNAIISKLLTAGRSQNKMSVKSQLSRLLALTVLGLPLSLPLAASAQAPALIPGKQCVYNNSAFSVNVEWYNPGAVVFKGGDPKNYKNYTILENQPPRLTSQNVTAGRSSCTDVANRTAVVRIVGHSIANDAIIISAGTLTGVATSVGGAFACAGSFGAGCVALAVVAPATAGAIAAVDKALPAVEEIAYIGSPGTTNYLDISGTIWNVGLANNVSLSKSRGFAVVGDWVTGGEPGPKSITYNNQAGYVAQMTVMYMQKQKIGNQIVVMPVVKSTGKQSLGFSRHINIPVEIENTPIQVFITGVGTTKKDVFSTTIPANFSGNQCYKSYGTIFNAKGSTCR